MGKRLELDIHQRTEMVLALLRREEPATQIARRCGISEATLYRLRDQFLDGGKAALANGRGKVDGRSQQIEHLQKDVARRDRVIGELTIANRVLKKTSDGLL
jgi:transposase-like protein